MLSMNSKSVVPPHPELQILRCQLHQMLADMASFGPVIPRPPVLDASYDANKARDLSDDSLMSDSVPGLRVLRDTVSRDLDVLNKFLNDPNCASHPPLSTNAPYLIAVWNEILLAPPPVTAIWRTYSEKDKSSTPHRRGPQKPPGVKVDVIAEDGRRWIRVNTTKNSRMLAEFREIDSYLTDSEDESDDPTGQSLPTLAETEFDNSVLKMGRTLVAAAAQNPTPSSAEVPTVTMRLTRLDPSPDNPKDHDPRIARTIDKLRRMGIDVQLGERDTTSFSRTATPQRPRIRLEPTLHVNLDLSILIALVSDITHSPLPASLEEAGARFEPPPQYREWKKKRLEALKGPLEHDITDAEEGAGKHSRALANQAVQEMQRGLIQGIHDRLLALGTRTENARAFPRVEFWTTPEARDRCLKIVLSKIGGPKEKRRARALFPTSATPPLSVEDAEDTYWHESRYPKGFLPLLPIRIFPSSEPDALLEPPTHVDGCALSPFFSQLAQTCRDVLAQETMPDPREVLLASAEAGEGNSAIPGQAEPGEDGSDEDEVISRATVTRASPRLTAHTVQSLLWGATRGWTTLTANKTSVKAILREIRARHFSEYTVRIGGDQQTGTGTLNDAQADKAALWVVDPRSLAEGMRSDVTCAVTDNS